MMDGWTQKELGKILTLNYGWSLPETKRVAGAYPVYGSNGIVGSHREPLVESSGLILGRKGSAGNVHYSRKPFCPIDTTFFITPSDTPLDIEFLFYLLRHIDLKRVLGDVGVPGLNREVAYREKAHFPIERDEQRKIAYVLSLVQRGIAQQERLIALTTELKKSLMHKLFTEGLPACREASGAGRRGGPQKQTEIGPVPESWEVVELGEIAAIERGKFAHRPRNHPRFYGGSTPFVQTGDVSNCNGRIENYSQTLNEEGVRISKVFPAGTILITIAANIGFTGILEFDSACPDSLIGLTPSNRVSAEFLQYYLSTQQPEMDRLAPRGTQKNINIQFLKPWPVRLPSREEQVGIAECLGTVDTKLRNATKKKNTLTDLFRTLLYQLMTAQIRVHIWICLDLGSILIL